MKSKWRLFTIGFTQTSAEHFFKRLREAEVKRVVDVRLRPESQLAGFAKGRDLKFFLREILGVDYQYEPRLAPTAALLEGFKQKRLSWKEYEGQFSALLEERCVVSELELEHYEDACLLCSEERPEHCHRRLVAEMISKSLRLSRNIEIIHL